MGDLISRKSLLDELNKNKIPYNSDVNYYIMHAETAYDVNKVLKELRESAITLCTIKGLGSLVVLGFDDVIEIVQKGGVEHEGNTAHRKEE